MAEAGVLEATDVRLIGLAQTRDQARLLLFDTLSIPGTSAGVTDKHGTSVDRCGSPQHRRKAKDEELLGELMFGSIPVAFSATTAKVHEVQQPPSATITLLFDAQDSADLSRRSSEAELSVSREGKKVATLLSKHRKFFNEQLARAGAEDTETVIKSAATERRSSEGSDSSGGRSGPRSYKPAVLIGICIVVQTKRCPNFSIFVRRLFPAIEQILRVLRRMVLGVIQRTSSEALLDVPQIANQLQLSGSFKTALADAQQRLCKLYTAPRLDLPIWQLSTTGASDAATEKFSSSIMELSRTFASFFGKGRRGKSFLAQALTLVLTHHTGWVGSVAEPRPWYDEDASDSRVELRDLFGAMTVPASVSRTLVVGTDRAIVSKMVEILAHFIRSRATLHIDHMLGSKSKPSDLSLRFPTDSSSLKESDPDGSIDHANFSSSLIEVTEDLYHVRLDVSDNSENGEDNPVSTVRDSSIFENSLREAAVCGVCSGLAPFFILQGSSSMPSMQEVADDLSRSIRSPVIGLPVSDARCIILDTDALTCEVIVVAQGRNELDDRLAYTVEAADEPADLVQQFLNTFLACTYLKLPPAVCLEQVEAWLAELCEYSRIYEECGEGILPPDLTSSDIPLLDAVRQYLNYIHM